MAKNYKKFVEDIWFIGVANLLNNFKSLLIIPLITKVLGSVDYGVWVQFKTTLLVLAPFVALGVQNSIVKFLAGQKNKQNIREDFYSCVFISLMGGIILGAIFYLLSEQFSIWIFRSRDYEIIIKIFSFVLLLESVNLLFLEYLKTFRYMRFYFITLVFETVFELGTIAYSVLRGYGILGAVVSLLIIRIIFCFIRYIYIYNDIGLGSIGLSNIKKNIAFGLPLAFSSIFFFVLNSGDRYVINYFLGLRYVGIYSVAYSLAYIIVLVTAPIGYILYPTLSDFCNNRKYEEAILYLRYSTKYLLLIGIASVFGILVLSKNFILIFSTNEFISAQALMPLLLAGMFIFQIGVISEYSMILFNQVKQIMLLHLILAVINIVLNIIFVPYLGMMGAAFTTLITFVGFSIFTIGYSKKFLNLSFNYFSISLKSIAAAIIMYLSIFLLNPKSLSMVLLSIFSGSIVYFTLLYLLKTFDEKEIIFFKNLLLSFNQKTRS